MKKLFLLLPLFALVWACTPAGEGGSFSGTLVDQTDSISYAQGILMGKQLKDLAGEGEPALMKSAPFKAGLDEGLAGNEGLLNEKVAQDVMMKFQMGLQQAAQKKQQEEAEMKSGPNRAKGTAFLAENGTKEGVVTTASGLQYKILREGNGAMPTTADKVEVHYEGRLLDGTVFDDSYSKGKPATFGVTQVIKGWTEGLQLMKVGSKFQFYIPTNLAYGNQAPPSIGPGQTLIFDVEMLKINP